LSNVATGDSVWLAGAADAKSYQWTLDANGATGSVAKLSSSKDRFVHFLADTKGTYVVTESVSGAKFTIYAGTFTGVNGSEGNCTICHKDGGMAPDNFTPWGKTPHASALANGLDGKSGEKFAMSCIGCHTVGSSEGGSGGFNEVNKTAKWSFTKPAPGTWDKLKNSQPSLAKLAGVQCESCHGPQSSSGHLKGKARTSYSSAVCATCHQKSPHYYSPGQWAGSGHANRGPTEKLGTFENNGLKAAMCGRCHTAQGFRIYAAQLAKGDAGPLKKDDGKAADETWLRKIGLQLADAEPTTCAACHAPHGNDAPSQLRVYDKIDLLPSGLSNITGAGTGAVCIACHNGRVGEHSDFVAAATTWDTGPPPSEGDVLYGFNAYFMPRYTPSAHLSVKNTCSGCHIATPTTKQLAAGQDLNHAFKTDASICSDCHGKKVDGAAYAGAVKAQLAGLSAAIGAKANKLFADRIKADGKLVARAWDPKTRLYSSKTGANLELKAAPTAAAPASIELMSGWMLTLPAKVEVTWSDGSKTSVSEVYVTSADLASGGKAVFKTSDLLMKASWNHRALVEDGSHGVHNPAFYQAVIDATHKALK